MLDYKKFTNLLESNYNNQIAYNTSFIEIKDRENNYKSFDNLDKLILYKLFCNTSVISTDDSGPYS